MTVKLAQLPVPHLPLSDKLSSHVMLGPITTLNAIKTALHCIVMVKCQIPLFIDNLQFCSDGSQPELWKITENLI